MSAAINRIIGRRRTLLADDGPAVNATAAGLLTNLVGYWKLEDNTAAVGTNLSDVGTPSYTTGKVNNAVTLNGSTALTVANASMGDLKVNGDFSIACWFKTDGSGGFGEIVASWYNFSGSQRAWWINYEGVSDAIFFDVSTNGSSSQPTNYLNAKITSLYGGSHDPNQWFFMVCTYNDTTGEGVINLDNGNQTATDTKTNPGIHQSTADFFIGKDGGGRNLAGDVDEFGFWNRVLTPAEISYLYNSGSGRTYPFT